MLRSCFKPVMWCFWRNIARADAARKASQTPPPGIAGARELAYRPTGQTAHRLDVYWPEGTRGLLPTVVDIHGGGWSYGNKELNEYYAMSLAQEGFAVANLNYRLVTQTGLRGMVQDIFRALHWLAAYGGRFHCDCGRLFLTGDSAGGHLAGLVCCVQASPRLQKLYGVAPLPFAIRAVGICHGVTDFDALEDMPGEMARMLRGMAFLLAGCGPLAKTVGLRAASQGIELPPICLVSSEADPFHSQSLAMANWMAGRNIPLKTIFCPNTEEKELGHVFEVGWPHWPESRETNKAMLQFFLQQLRVV